MFDNKTKKQKAKLYPLLCELHKQQQRIFYPSEINSNEKFYLFIFFYFIETKLIKLAGRFCDKLCIFFLVSQTKCITCDSVPGFEKVCVCISCNFLKHCQKRKEKKQHKTRICIFFFLPNVSVLTFNSIFEAIVSPVIFHIL